MIMQKLLLESTPYEGLKNGTHIDVEVSYTKGGTNFLSGSFIPRGYYLSVTPVTHDGVTTSFTLFTGKSKLLLETARFSKKQFEQAIEMARNAAPALVAQVLETERAA